MGGAAFGLEGGILLSLARGLSVAALLSVFGSLLFRVAVAPSGVTGPAGFDRSWRRWFWAGWWAAVLATMGWLALQAASMASAEGLLETVTAVPTVLLDTSFGHIVAFRLLVLLAIGAAVRLQRLGIATLLSAIATALQGGHSHAAAMYDGPSLLLLSDVFHLLAAGPGWAVSCRCSYWSGRRRPSSRPGRPAGSRRWRPRACSCWPLRPPISSGC